MARTRKKKFRPPGLDFEGKYRRVESIARHAGIELTRIRLAEYLFFNGENWTVRTCIEFCDKGTWKEVDWVHGSGLASGASEIDA